MTCRHARVAVSQQLAIAEHALMMSTYFSLLSSLLHCSDNFLTSFSTSCTAAVATARSCTVGYTAGNIPVTYVYVFDLLRLLPYVVILPFAGTCFAHLNRRAAPYALNARIQSSQNFPSAC
jgi:hypothetical protein